MTMVLDADGKIHQTFSTRIWEGADWSSELLSRLGGSIDACLEKRR
jgi:hypothetical protein